MSAFNEQHPAKAVKPGKRWPLVLWVGVYPMGVPTRSRTIRLSRPGLGCAGTYTTDGEASAAETGLRIAQFVPATGGRILRVMERARLDAIAVAASVLALAMFVVYLSVIRQQEGEPATWAVAALIGGAAAAAYGAVLTAPYRRAALMLSGLALVALGVLAILTIGLPILLAGALCLVAAARQKPLPAP
jgi:hypothetical protein